MAEALCSRHDDDVIKHIISFSADIVQDNINGLVQDYSIQGSG